jgi:hypothetical protein
VSWAERLSLDDHMHLAFAEYIGDRLDVLGRRYDDGPFDSDRVCQVDSTTDQRHAVDLQQRLLEFGGDAAHATTAATGQDYRIHA